MNPGRSPLHDPMDSSPAVLRARVADSFGGFAPELGQAFRDPGIPDHGLLEEWKRLVAEEILLASLCSIPVHGTWVAALLAISPLAGGDETLGDLVGKVAWVATIPLSRPAPCNSGALVRIWGLRGGEGSHLVEGELPSGGDERFVIRLGGWDCAIAGRSWQLAAALAMRAASGQRMDLMYQLARYWIVTGEVDGDRVNRVEPGNKAHIRSMARTWLVPEAGHEEFVPLLDRVRACGTLESAWRQISGEGTLDGGRIPWPQGEDVFEMHATVSQAVRPIILSILLTRPARICLWHSSLKADSEGYADFVIGFLKHPRVRGWSGWEGRVPEVAKYLLSHDDLVAGERALLDEGLATARGRTVLFNITGGNFLMKLAVHNVARLNPSIWLIYREGSLAANEAVLIRNAGHMPSVGIIAPEKVSAGVNWECIREFKKPASIEALVDEVFSVPQP